MTDLEKAAFASALYEWSKTPFIGGQSRHGCGLIELDLDNWMEIQPLAHMHGQPINVSPSAAYVDHLRGHKDDILSALKEIG